MMAEKPFTCDYAKSNRSVCRGCSLPIVKDTCRLAIMLQCRNFDGKVPNWYHLHCFFLEHMPNDTKDISDFKSLKFEDQFEIQNIVVKGESPYASTENRINMKRVIALANSKATLCNYEMDYAKNCSTKCSFCESPFKKQQIRVNKKAPKAKYHLECFAKVRGSLDFLECGSAIFGFNNLEAEDQETVKTTLPSLRDDADVTPTKKQKIDQPSCSSQNSTEETTNTNDDMLQMYDYRKDLRENIEKKDLMALMTHNRQLAKCSWDNLLDRAADMLTFGALQRCDKCSWGQLVFVDDGYKCLNTKCNAMVTNPRRMFVDIPIDLKLKYNTLYSYEYINRTRPLAKSNGKSTNKPKNGPFLYKNFVILGFDSNEAKQIESKIKSLAGRVVSEIRRSVFALITTTDEVEMKTCDIQTSKTCNIYVVGKDFLNEFTNKTGSYSLDNLAKKHSLVDWGVELHDRVPDKFNKSDSGKSVRHRDEEEAGKRRMRIKNGIAIEPDSGLEDVAHVYQIGDVKYNAVLTRTNVDKNYNSYYKLQLLEHDTEEKYWVFRNWGRIGTTVGGHNVKEMDSLSEAKKKFKEYFKKFTGTKWEERHSVLSSARNGSYTMIDVNYEAKKSEIVDLYSHVADSTLSPAVAELMAIIFNVRSMEKMMLEYELDLQKMPLGKLSRSQIKSAYQILNDATWYLQNHKKINKKQIVEITNQFYSHMPHNTALERPPLLDNLDFIKKKSDMLADLMEMETAFAMIQRGATGQNCNILDAYYHQLNAHIETLPTGCDEFHMIEEYLLNTHADTHRNYKLKILEIFKVARNGEDERYAPFKDLANRRLLWHGSRTTNFAGILSQGLRIAPVEAPVTGYMFGKGIYFADMVSKSANYCCATDDNSTGLLLLCEVALGNMIDKQRAEPIVKLPKNVNSVRGVGRTEPDEQAMRILPDGVQVPLGKPITDLDASNTSLLYNEYIVYDVSQVRIKYLLKLDFKF